MKASASGPHAIICPLCEAGELNSSGEVSVSCDSCGHAFEGSVLITLKQVVALPDAMGEHACECGHPEMRRLPDGVFYYPVCRSEVIPVEAGLT